MHKPVAKSGLRPFFACTGGGRLASLSQAVHGGIMIRAEASLSAVSMSGCCK